jgi:hypothetical protein
VGKRTDERGGEERRRIEELTRIRGDRDCKLIASVSWYQIWQPSLVVKVRPSGSAMVKVEEMPYTDSVSVKYC